ncbi:MAG TPA: hypothetical protein VFB39_07390 [Solirubrobacteraceae bacterium]|jgi:hypothetical protein|nr:hypothetical protein [Solirubrobacteraceae bacterium]
MKGDWRDWRPAIWLAMLGVAVMLLIAPFWYGAVFIGAAIGVAIRIEQRRRRIAAAAASAKIERRSSKQKRKRR